MFLEEITTHPQKYKQADYRGTSLSCRVHFAAKQYVVSTSNQITELKQLYCVFQDSFFYGLLVYKNAKTRSAVQAKRLLLLDGRHAPRIFAYDDGMNYSEFFDGRTAARRSKRKKSSRPVIVREFIDGKTIQDTPHKRWALDAAADSIGYIHSKEIIFDPHVKNLVERKPDVYWVEIGRIKDEINQQYAKAENLLKLVYSTWTYTRNSDLTRHAAKAVRKHYTDSEVVGCLKQMIAGIPGRVSMHFTTRIPFNQKLQKELALILKK